MPEHRHDYRGEKRSLALDSFVGGDDDNDSSAPCRLLITKPLLYLTYDFFTKRSTVRQIAVPTN